MEVRYLISGDSTLVVEFGDKISPEINGHVIALMRALYQRGIRGIVEMLPTYRSLGINYDPLIISMEDLKGKVESLQGELWISDKFRQRTIEIPVAYGGEYGPDIENVAVHSGVDVEEVVRIHSSGEYLVYMLGFTPGFPYLGGMDEKIATPRLDVPRKLINGGSVGIAGTQTGIYPIDSPGGWQIIGRTPLKLFDATCDKEFLLEAGDMLKFVPVNTDEYERIKKELDQKTYRMCIKGSRGWGELE